VEGYTPAERDDDLSCVAVFALPLSGQEEGRPKLRAVVSLLPSAKGTRGAQTLASAFRQAIKESEKVQQLGLDRYYGQPRPAR
jgi:hypothetical protein